MPGTLAPASTNIYNMGIILSSLAGGLSYYLICKVFPPTVMPPSHANHPMQWEGLAKTEGYFADDDNVPSYIKFADDSPATSVVEHVGMSRQESEDGKDEKNIVGVKLREV